MKWRDVSSFEWLIAFGFVVLAAAMIWLFVQMDFGRRSSRDFGRSVGYKSEPTPTPNAAAYFAGETDGKEIAAALANDGAGKINDSAGVMLLAETRARVTKVPADEVKDWTWGWSAGYNSEMARLGK